MRKKEKKRHIIVVARRCVLGIAVRIRLMHATTMLRAFAQPGQARFMHQDKGDTRHDVVVYKKRVYNQIC